MSEIDSEKRKELTTYLKEQYRNIKVQFENQINVKAMIALSGLFSVIFKIVKKGNKNDYEFIIKILNQLKQIITTEIIPDDMMTAINTEKSKMPKELSDNFSDEVIKSMLRKFNNPIFISTIDTLIMKFSLAIQ
jgi:hypothetical protein